MLRALISFAAVAAAGIVGTIALAIIELYLTGHGLGSITRETITWAPGGVHMSAADLLLIMVVFAAAALAWQLTKPLAKGKDDETGNN